MSSNAYNPYSYPYQQSSAQQYSVYQTALPSNNVAQSSHQYQQPPTTQAQDYMSYQPQSYANQSTGYGTAQETSWNNNSCGEARETTSRAAEVLRNMSNPSYMANNTAATNQTSFTAANTPASHSSRYATGTSRSPQVQVQQQQPQSVYAQSQSRPRSVNNHHAQQGNRGLPSPAMAAGHPSQRTQSTYNQQQQRSASPAQPQYKTAPISNARGATMTATANTQYGEYSARQLPSVETPATSQNATSSNAHNYGNAQMPPAAIAPPAPSASMADTYSAQGTTTVDPLAVYDPWPEYQRKQAAQKALEDAARAEQERIAEEMRKVEEQRKEEERKQQEEEEEDNLRQPPSKTKPNNSQKQQQPNMAEKVSAAPASDDGPGQALENEIRAMMAKMRELNSKNPALVARIWEEERRAKAPKPPTAQYTAAPQPTQSAQPNTPQIANSKKKTASKEAPNPNVPKPATPAVAQAVPVGQAQPTANRTAGNTIWPTEKKAHLAYVASVYLNAQNPGHHVECSSILTLLDGNPSYIELCGQLEQMGLKLDRAVFAKTLLTTVPDVNLGRKSMPKPAPAPVQKPHVPPTVMKKEVATPVAPSPQFAPASGSPANGGSHPPFPDNASPAAPLAPGPAPVAEMVPIKPELRKPASKEEAARKRNLSDLVDLTQLSEEDMGPPPKRLASESTRSFGSPHPHQDAMDVDEGPSTPNFPIVHIPSQTPQPLVPQPIQLPNELRYNTYVEPLNRKKALRRNNYNPATIARDVLLACGRHPSERSLNQHLDRLRTTLPQVTFDSDLSTLRWDLIDPGKPPPGYFKDSVQAFAEDADDEDDSGNEDARRRPRAPSNAIGGEGGAQTKVQALPEATNPFKQNRRGRPPRHSFPDGASPATPKRPKDPASMSSSAPRPSSGGAGIGYQAFRSAIEYGSDGQPLPKKRGRPIGWRKAIHGSVAAQSRPAMNGDTGPLSKHQPTQPSSLRHVHTGQNNAPIRIESRSPSVANRVAQYQSYKCKWLNCKAELHNLDTLKKHVFKVHRKETPHNTLDCLWNDCGKEVTNSDPLTNMSLERHQPYSFDLESNWRSHIQQSHFDPLSWELGDGPASGLSGSHDYEAYLSDAQGRRVTPRITVDPERLEAIRSSPHAFVAASRGCGRRPKRTAEQEAHDAHERLVRLKTRIGGPGMDRGGATLVNDKRRRGLIEGDETEEKLVDVED